MPHGPRLVALTGLLTIASMAVTASAVTGVELIRNEPFRYGRFEARIQFAPGDGVVSSFFLWRDGSEQPNVFWNEIDIEKLGDACAGYSSNAIYGLPETNHNQDIAAAADLCRGYHTHVIEWTPDHLSWILDGMEVRRITGADLQAFEDNALPGMQMRFNLWVGNPDFGGNFTPAILPVHQFINWVSYSRYAPGAGDDGGDFALVFREDFDAPLGGGWSLGTWQSPFNLSVYSPTNLTVRGGKAILSLTADNAPGFAGQPPDDPADTGDAPDDTGDAPDDTGDAPDDTGDAPGDTAGEDDEPTSGMGEMPADDGTPDTDPAPGGGAASDPSPALPEPDLSVGDDSSATGRPASTAMEPSENPSGAPAATDATSGSDVGELDLSGLPAGPEAKGRARGCGLAAPPPGSAGAMALACLAWLGWLRRRRSAELGSEFSRSRASGRRSLPRAPNAARESCPNAHQVSQA